MAGDGNARAHWRKSQRSGSGECVECAAAPDVVMIRDSKDPNGPRLAFDHDTWRDFIEAVKDGAFDCP